jgi:hypothetical protein
MSNDGYIYTVQRTHFSTFSRGVDLDSFPSLLRYLGCALLIVKDDANDVRLVLEPMNQSQEKMSSGERRGYL